MMAVQRAHLFIEQAEALGEPPEDPLPVFSVLFGFWNISQVAFNGDDMGKLAAQFFTLAESQGSTVPLMVGNRIMGITKVLTADFAGALAHFDQSLALYHPAEHRPLAARFGHDNRVSVLCWRALALWVLGYSERAVADTNQVLKDAREIGQAANLLTALAITSYTLILCGTYDAADARINELLLLADAKGASLRKAEGMTLKGSLSALTRKAADAVQMIASGISAWRSTGATQWTPLYLSYLTRAYAELGQLDDAWRSIGEAMTAVEANKESWYEAEVNRMAGEIAHKSPVPDAVKAEAYFARALAVARGQQAKSFELRAAMSMARLWRDRGKQDEARDLLAPVYGWFTEGFDTLDLKQAKTLFEELAS
jgi:predicted ATPase